jgi:2-polyprenyl-6-methoxyphenol hydroxylase-like FAD-dependent oxidoreductase
MPEVVEVSEEMIPVNLKEGERMWLVNRGWLRGLFGVGLEAYIEYGKGVVVISDSSSGEVELHFSDGTSPQAGLVVNASGINSSLREYLTPGYKHAATKTQAIYGKISITGAAREAFLPRTEFHYIRL